MGSVILVSGFECLGGEATEGGEYGIRFSFGGKFLMGGQSLVLGKMGAGPFSLPTLRKR